MIQLFANGTDITPKIQGRLISCSLSDQGTDQVDELSLQLSNHDGQLELPEPGAKLHIWLPDHTAQHTTLVDMGEFNVDTIETGGPPTTLSIRATSTDITNSLKTQREQSWDDTTLGDVFQEIASRNQLEPQFDETLAARAIKHLDQTTESDLSLINRLGKEHDAIATAKSGKLVLMPIGTDTTSAGAPLPTLIIDISACTNWRYQKSKTTYTGVTAHYQNREEAKRESVTVGSAENPFVMRKTSPDKDIANTHAKTRWETLKRGEQSLSLDLENLLLDATTAVAIQLTGFTHNIPDSGWVIASANHNMSGSGHNTSLQLEFINR